MNYLIILAVAAAIAGIAAAVHFSRRSRDAEAQQQESERVIMDWLEANTMLKNSAFESFRALFRAGRRW